MNDILNQLFEKPNLENESYSELRDLLWRWHTVAPSSIRTQVSKNVDCNQSKIFALATYRDLYRDNPKNKDTVKKIIHNYYETILRYFQSIQNQYEKKIEYSKKWSDLEKKEDPKIEFEDLD